MWRNELCDEGWEEIVGTVIIGWGREDRKWEAHRFLYVPRGDITPPSPYMVDILLALWALQNGARGHQGGTILTLDSALTTVIDGASGAPPIKGSQQMLLRDSLQSKVEAAGWKMTYLKPRTESPHILWDDHDLAIKMADTVGVVGILAPPTGLTLAIHDHTFQELQRAAWEDGHWAWKDDLLNGYAYSDTMLAVQKVARLEAAQKRDEDRRSRGDPPKWSSFNTLAFAARIRKLDTASIAQRGHYNRLYHERHWTVGQNRRKGAKDPAQQLRDGRCLLCEQPDTYDHWIRECPCHTVAAQRSKHRQLFREWSASLPEGLESDIAKHLLLMSESPDGYRITLGNWSEAQYMCTWTKFITPDPHIVARCLQRAYLRFTDATGELWRARSAALGMKTYIPPIRNAHSRYYAVRKGHRPGIYYVCAEAIAQVNGFSRPEWQSCSTLKEAMDFLDAVEDPADVITDDTPGVMEIYTDGSYLKSTKQAGWGMVVLHHRDRLSPPATRVLHHEAFGAVILDPRAGDFQGADRLTNNTGELSAIGAGLRWVAENVGSTRPCSIGVLRIVSDSDYALGVLSRPVKRNQANAAIIRHIKVRLAEVREWARVVLHWTKAHTGLDSADSYWNDRADRMANQGAAIALPAEGAAGVSLDHDLTGPGSAGQDPRDGTPQVGSLRDESLSTAPREPPLRGRHRPRDSRGPSPTPKRPCVRDWQTTAPSTLPDPGLAHLPADTMEDQGGQPAAAPAPGDGWGGHRLQDTAGISPPCLGQCAEAPTGDYVEGLGDYPELMGDFTAWLARVDQDLDDADRRRGKGARAVAPPLVPRDVWLAEQRALLAAETGDANSVSGHGREAPGQHSAPGDIGGTVTYPRDRDGEGPMLGPATLAMATETIGRKRK